MLGQLPAELLGDFEAMRLGALGIVRTQIDVDESPAVFVADLAAQAIDIVVVAFDGDGLGTVNGRADDFSLLEAVGDEHITIQARLGGVGGN